MTATAVYRLYDDAGCLLYVGISSQPDVRWQQHAEAQPWWGEVDHKATTVAWFAEREEAASKELRAIVAEVPRYNVVRPRAEKAHSMTVRFPDQELAENLATVALVDGQPVIDVIRQAVADHVKARKADSRFRAALREHIGKARRLLGDDEAA